MLLIYPRTAQMRQAPIVAADCVMRSAALAAKSSKENQRGIRAECGDKCLQTSAALLILKKDRFVSGLNRRPGDRMALPRKIQIVRVVLAGRREFVAGSRTHPVAAFLGCVPNRKSLISPGPGEDTSPYRSSQRALLFQRCANHPGLHLLKRNPSPANEPRSTLVRSGASLHALLRPQWRSVFPRVPVDTAHASTPMKKH
jgi:hypothetical protein